MNLQKEILASFRCAHFYTEYIVEGEPHFLLILVDNSNALVFVIDFELARCEPDTLAL